MYGKEVMILVLIGLLLVPASAVVFENSAGPWNARFDSNHTLNARNEYITYDESGYSVWAMTLIDEKGHEIGWLFFRSYPNPQKAANDALDEQMEVAIDVLKITSPVKSSTTVGNMSARMAEGYSSTTNRNWRAVSWPYKPEYDDFTGTNMSKHFVTISSLFDKSDYEDIVRTFSMTSRLD